MARARFIRPEFFTDEKLSDLPFGACVLFSGIWCHSDLRGVFEHSPRLLRGLIFPMRDGIETAAVGKWLDELEAAGVIGRFEANGKTWGFVTNWEKHQQISGRERDIGTPRPPPPGQDEDTPERVPSVSPEHARAASPTATATPTATPTVTVTPSPASARTAPPSSPSTTGIFGEIVEPVTPEPIEKRKTFGDFQAMHPRIHVGRDERDAWEAGFHVWEWDPMDHAYREICKTLTDRKHRVLLSQMSKFIDDNYEVGA